MRALTKYLAGAAAAAALTVTAAGPASAQSWDRRDNGIDSGDIITGVAVIGGIAAILSAFGRDGDRYGYDNRYRYRDDYSNAVNACGYEAERYGRGGQVSITDVDRRSSNSYRVRGVIDAGYAYRDNRYGAYGRTDRYGRYDPYARNGNYGRNDPYGRNGNYGRYGNDRYGYGNDQRVEFACTARANGRVTDFDIDRDRY